MNNNYIKGSMVYEWNELQKAADNLKNEIKNELRSNKILKFLLKIFNGEKND